MIVKFNPQGMVTMVLGRKPEAIDFLERYSNAASARNRSSAGGARHYGRPTDVRSTRRTTSSSPTATRTHAS
jgi:hypothetical protein